MSLISKFLMIITSTIIGLIIFEVLLEISGKYNSLSNQELVLSNAIYEKPKLSTLKNEHPDLKKIILNKYDGQGIRNHDKIETKNKKNIIGIFGDSHVENINIKNDFQFTTLLDRYFKDENFVNYGVGGYSIDQIFIRYLNYSNHDIKKVYYIFSGNDAGSLNSNNLIEFKKDEFELIKPKFRLIQKIIGKLNLSYFLIDIYYIVRSQIYQKHTTVDISNYPKKLAEKIYYKFLADGHAKNDSISNIEYFNKILKKFKEIAIKNNSTFQIIVLPKKEEHEAFMQMVNDQKDYDVINLYILNKKIIDNLKEEIIFKNDSHFNEYGNLLIYQLIKSYLINEEYFENFFLKSNIKKKIDSMYN